MPYDVDKPGDVKKMREKLQKTYGVVDDTAARQAIHVFNSVFPKGEGAAWGAVHSTMQERGLSKKARNAMGTSSPVRVAYRYLLRLASGPDDKGSNWKSVGRGGIKGWTWSDPQPEGNWAPAQFTVIETDDAENAANNGYSYILMVREPSGQTWQYRKLLHWPGVAMGLAGAIFKTWTYPEGMADNFRRNFSRRPEYRLAAKGELSKADKDKIIDLLAAGKGKPIPDSKVHALAEELGIAPDEVESYIYGIASELAAWQRSTWNPGGKAEKAKIKPEDFPKETLDKGIEVELEHTTDRELAKKIVLDHLVESADYYDALDKMEKGLEKKAIGPRERSLTKLLREWVDDPIDMMELKRAIQAIRGISRQEAALVAAGWESKTPAERRQLLSWGAEEVADELMAPWGLDL